MGFLFPNASPNLWWPWTINRRQCWYCDWIIKIWHPSTMRRRWSLKIWILGGNRLISSACRRPVHRHQHHRHRSFYGYMLSSYGISMKEMHQKFIKQRNFCFGRDDPVLRIRRSRKQTKSIFRPWFTLRRRRHSQSVLIFVAQFTMQRSCRFWAQVTMGRSDCGQYFFAALWLQVMGQRWQGRIDYTGPINGGNIDLARLFVLLVVERRMLKLSLRYCWPFERLQLFPIHAQ